MSYCVHCGVELSASERKCPLCGTEVVDPAAPVCSPAQKPYPERVDPIRSKRVDRRFFASIAAVLLLIPLGVSLLCDLLPDGRFSWSVYVLGAMALIFVIGVFPFFFKRGHALRFLAADCLTVLLYLLFIDMVNGMTWFFTIGLPITLMCAFAVMMITYFKYRGSNHLSLFKRAALTILVIGLLCVGIETVLHLAAGEGFLLNWSSYVLIPCIVLALVAMLIDRRPDIQETIRKRMFF